MWLIGLEFILIKNDFGKKAGTQQVRIKPAHSGWYCRYRYLFMQRLMIR
jgi:hypothetical protein